jgi:hypothetical protein
VRAICSTARFGEGADLTFFGEAGSLLTGGVFAGGLLEGVLGRTSGLLEDAIVSVGGGSWLNFAGSLGGCIGSLPGRLLGCLGCRDIFFHPTPYGSRQVVHQAGKPVAFCKFNELMQWRHQS